MLITFLAMRSLWLVWRERQQRRLARKSLHQLTEMGPAGSEHQFWPAVRARYQHDTTLSDAKRVRSRKAISRLARISERKLARQGARKIDPRKYTQRPR